MTAPAMDARLDDQGPAKPPGDTTADAFVDADSDGYAAAPSGDDCADDDAAIHPGADEVCDAGGADEDCDGLSHDNTSQIEAALPTPYP